MGWSRIPEKLEITYSRRWSPIDFIFFILVSQMVAVKLDSGVEISSIVFLVIAQPDTVSPHILPNKDSPAVMVKEAVPPEPYTALRQEGRDTC